MLWLAKPTKCRALTPRQSAELFYIPSPGAAPPSLCLEEPWHSHCSWLKVLVFKRRREQTAAPHSSTPCLDQKALLCRTGALLPSAPAQPPRPPAGHGQAPSESQGPGPSSWGRSTSHRPSLPWAPGAVTPGSPPPPFSAIPPEPAWEMRLVAMWPPRRSATPSKAALPNVPVSC